jgi:uncharacterized protein
MLFRRRNPLNWIERLRLAVWPANGWNRSMRYLGKRVLRLSASPHAIAAGFAAGVFASFTPFIGFHFLISFIVAFAIGGNLLAAAFGTAVGNPFTFPIIWLSSYKVGNLVLGLEHREIPGHEIAATLARQPFEAIFPLMRPILIGGLPLGFVFGAIAYLIVLWAVKAYQDSRRRRLGARRKKSGDESDDVEAGSSI